MRRPVIYRSLIWVALLALLLAACTGDEDPTATPVPDAPDTATEQPSPTPQPEDPTATPEPEPEPTATATEQATEAPEPTSPPEPTMTPEPEPEPADEPPVDLESLEIELVEVASGLDTPVKVVSAYDGSNRIFNVEKPGSIAIVQDGIVQEERFLSISDKVNSEGSEQGLLGLAFHPDFTNNGYFYVNYNDLNGDTVISRFETNEDRTAAIPESEQVLLSIEQPASNHNGGHLLFGPDGYLYIGTGDGGGAGDTFEQAQNPTTLLGKMLRIDVDGGDPYGIPDDNPFLDNDEVRDEIWAIGLRNPWRYDFDRKTGDLYIADVGQNRIEEINVQPGDSIGGENYGWPMMEGTECFQTEECDTSGLVLPVTEYMHDMGCSVTGGNVYRGEAFPQMQGVYFYSDFCSGNIWGLVENEGEWQTRLFLPTGYNVSSFGEDEAGEIYLVDMYAGILHQIVATE